MMPWHRRLMRWPCTPSDSGLNFTLSILFKLLSTLLLYTLCWTLRGSSLLLFFVHSPSSLSSLPPLLCSSTASPLSLLSSSHLRFSFFSSSFLLLTLSFFLYIHPNSTTLIPCILYFLRFLVFFDWHITVPLIALLPLQYFWMSNFLIF